MDVLANLQDWLGNWKALFNLLLQPAVWPFVLIFTVLPGAAIFGHWHRVRMERAVFQEGVEVMATINDVRVLEGDCTVEYTFVDRDSGKTFSRFAVVGFQMKTPPTEGELIAVKYLPSNPKWSRVIGELHLASR